MPDRVYPLSPWWRDRFDELDDAADRYQHPLDDPASPDFDPMDVEPRVDCYWDELAEDRQIRGG